MLADPGRFRKDLGSLKCMLSAESKLLEVPQDPSGYVATTANRNHEIRLEIIEDLLRGGLT